MPVEYKDFLLSSELSSDYRGKPDHKLEIIFDELLHKLKSSTQVPMCRINFNQIAKIMSKFNPFIRKYCGVSIRNS